MKQKIVVSAPGKIILMGEHAVVYGKPAIIAAVNKRCFVEIYPRKDKKIKIISINYKKNIITDFEKIIAKFNKAQKDWDRYNLNNDIELLKSVTKNPLDYPQIILGQFLNYYKINSLDGFNVNIDSQIPLGAGMGSSGALAVAIIGSLFLLTKKKFDKKIINEIALLSEQKKHGNPSGGDNVTSCFGGLVWFTKDFGMNPLKIKLSQQITKNFYAVNTGTPQETTGEMVSIVKALHQKNPKFVNAVFADQEELTKQFLDALNNKQDDEIMRIMRAGERNLEKIGVVSPLAKSLIRKIENTGGAAKICGAGGEKKGAGILLVYHKSRKRLETLQSKKIDFSSISLDTQGVCQEL